MPADHFGQAFIFQQCSYIVWSLVHQY